MQLRKCCNHPYLFSPDIHDEGVTLEDIIEASGKLSVLDRILIKLKENDHRVVIFSQFTSMLDILADFLHLRGHQYARLDGSTNRVQRSIDIAAFNRPNSHICISSEYSCRWFGCKLANGGYVRPCLIAIGTLK